MTKADRTYAILFLAPVVILLALLVVYPVVYIWGISFTSFRLTAPDKQTFVGLSNFVEMFRNSRFLQGLGRSIYFTVISTIVSFILGFAIALLLNNRFAVGKSIFQAIYIIPMVLTPYVIGQTWRFLTDYQYGPIVYGLTLLGFPKISFVGEPFLAINTCILVDVWQWTPFVILILFAGLESLPTEPLEAARIDGASWWQELRYIRVPMMRLAISAVLLIRIMDAFREFDKIFALTAGGPGASTEVLSLYVYRTGFQYFYVGRAAAMALFMLFFIIITSNLYIRFTGVIRQE